MLANPQLIAAIESGAEVAEVVSRYGGAVFEFPNGEYCVFRDPQLQLVAIGTERCPECTDEDEGLGRVIEVFGPSAQSNSKVRIDTRCLAISDAGILKNKTLLEEFAKLRREDKEKQARDLLRSNGAAVRYGFNKLGDELTLFARSKPSPIAAMWPE